MKSFKKIIGLAVTGALSLALSVSSLFAGFTASASDSSTPIKVTPQTVAAQFVAGIHDVKVAEFVPSYILNRPVNTELGQAPYTGPKSGVKVTFKNTGKENPVEFNKTFKVSDFSNGGVVAQFIPLPSKAIFDKSTVEFKNLYVSVYEVDAQGKDTGKSINVIYSSAPNYSGAHNDLGLDNVEPSAYFAAFATNGSGEGQSQKPYAYFNNKNFTYEEVSYSYKNLPRYDGHGAGAGTAQHASMRETTTPLTITYFETGEGENKVMSAKASPVRDGFPDVLRNFNEYRDPNLHYSENVIRAGQLVDDPLIFAGFSENANLKVRFYIDSLVGTAKEASFMFYQIGTERLVNRISASTNLNGVKNYQYKLPTPTCLNAQGDIVTIDYNVSIAKADAPTVAVVSGNKLSSFTPASEGSYVATYSYLDTTENVEYSFPMSFEVVDSASAPIIISDVSSTTDFNKYYGSDYYVSAKVSCDVYKSGKPSLVAKLYKHNGTDYDYVRQIPLNKYLNLKTENLGFGRYRVDYVATDVYGRTQIASVNINALEEDRLFSSMVNGVDGQTENFYVGVTEQFIISSSDVTIYDAKKGRDYITADVYITDSEGNRELQSGDVNFKDYLATKGNVCAEYLVEYVYNDASLAFSKTYTKTIKVVDAIAPTIDVISDRYIFNAKIDEEKTVSESVVYLKAIKGTELLFGNIIAIDKVGEKYSLTDNIMWAVNKDGVADESVAPFKSSGLTYTVASNGEYVFRFTVFDEVNGLPNRYTSLVMIVTVQDNFYEIQVGGKYEIDNNYDSIKLSDLIVTDYYGNLVNVEKTVTAYDENNNVVWTGNVGDVKKFEKTGNYTIKTEAKLNGSVIATDVQSVMIYDELKPQIIVSGSVVKKALVGSEITLPTVTAVDENSTTNLIVDVTLGSTVINVYENKFVPIEAGNYVVTYTAIDLSGNENVYSYVIKVEGDKEGSIASFFNNYGLFVAIPLVVIAGALVALFFVIKAKKVKKVDDTTDDTTNDNN